MLGVLRHAPSSAPYRTIMTSLSSHRVPVPKNGVDYRGKLVLAPMVRSGECPSRLMALKYNADLVWGPETIDKALIGTIRRENARTGTVDFTRMSSNGAKDPVADSGQRESVIFRLHPKREGKKLIYQIGTANPETAVKAAKLIAGDVAGIDVNAGCPKPFSTSGGMGAALLKTPDVLEAILRALVAEVGEPFQIGISVKIRLLIDKALIGTIRRENARTGTVDFTRMSSNGAKDPVADSGQRESVIFRLHPKREGKKLIYQIGTANPETAVKAAKLIAGDVAGIDVNAGCPKPFSTSGGMGAALLKTPDVLEAILRALVAEVGEPFQIGISVKIRLLDDPADTEALVHRLCDTGITGLTIHCRTTPMRPRERAIREQLKLIARVCHENGVACLMNGDVTSRAEADILVHEYGVDGAMIATAAETNPSCFRPEQDGGLASWETVVKEYIKTALEVENRWGNTKYLLGQMIPGKQAAHKAMMHTKSYTEIIRALSLNDDIELVDMAQSVDKILEIGSFEKPKMTKAERKAANKAVVKVTGVGKEVPKKRERSATATGIKRNAQMAQLDMPPDIAQEIGAGSVPEQASVLAV
nr:trna-dihydrouridine(20) synthase [nad(p)+] [Quercus suber]